MSCLARLMHSRGKSIDRGRRKGPKAVHKVQSGDSEIWMGKISQQGCCRGGPPWQKTVRLEHSPAVCTSEVANSLILLPGWLAAGSPDENDDLTIARMLYEDQLAAHQLGADDLYSDGESCQPSDSDDDFLPPDLLRLARKRSMSPCDPSVRTENPAGLTHFLLNYSDACSQHGQLPPPRPSTNARRPPPRPRWLEKREARTEPSWRRRPPHLHRRCAAPSPWSI